jgi:hypothetical protein
MTSRYAPKRRFGIGCWLCFRPSASHFLFARAKEKVTKEKARPTSGFRCAQLPSFRHCSEGRHDGPSLAQHASFGILPNAPLRNTCTRPPDGGIWTESFGEFLLGLDFFQIKSQRFAAADKLIRARTIAPFQKAERNRCGVGRAAGCRESCVGPWKARRSGPTEQ